MTKIQGDEEQNAAIPDVETADELKADIRHRAHRAAQRVVITFRKAGWDIVDSVAFGGVIVDAIMAEFDIPANKRGTNNTLSDRS